MMNWNWSRGFGAATAIMGIATLMMGAMIGLIWLIGVWAVPVLCILAFFTIAIAKAA